MDDYTLLFSEEKLFEMYVALPENVKDAIFSVDGAGRIRNIGEKHGLNIAQIGELGRHTGMVMVGALHPRRFIQELEKRLNVNHDKAAEIAKAVNESIFFPIRESLRKIHDIEADEEVIEKNPAEKAEMTQKLTEERRTIGPISQYSGGYSQTKPYQAVPLQPTFRPQFQPQTQQPPVPPLQPQQPAAPQASQYAGQAQPMRPVWQPQTQQPQTAIPPQPAFRPPIQPQSQQPKTIPQVPQPTRLVWQPQQVQSGAGFVSPTIKPFQSTQQPIIPRPQPPVPPPQPQQPAEPQASQYAGQAQPPLGSGSQALQAKFGGTQFKPSAQPTKTLPEWAMPKSAEQIETPPQPAFRPQFQPQTQQPVFRPQFQQQPPAEKYSLTGQAQQFRPKPPPHKPQPPGPGGDPYKEAVE